MYPREVEFHLVLQVPTNKSHTLELRCTSVNLLHFLECIGSIGLSSSEPRLGIETDQALSFPTL